MWPKGCQLVGLFLDVLKGEEGMLQDEEIPSWGDPTDRNPLLFHGLLTIVARGAPTETTAGPLSYSPAQRKASHEQCCSRS